MSSNAPKSMLPRQRFLAALAGQPVDRPPVWIMRQAGRYLPEYRAIRQHHTFLQMVHQPDVATAITLQPVTRFGMDAAILFSDILTIPEALGQDVQFPEGGPVLQPVVRTAADVAALPRVDMREALAYVGQAVAQIRAELGDKTALLGFSGAPFTLACYMVEGKGTKQFEQIKAMLFAAPEVLTALLDRLADAVIDYLQMQLDAGADAVQLFDTWAGELRRADYDAIVRPSTERIVRTIRDRGGKIMVFARHPGHLLDSTLSLGAHGLGLDWRVDLTEANRKRQRAPGFTALQGNLDPIELFAPRAHIRKRVQEMHAAVGQGWIANLGHGVVPATPIAGVEAFVQAVQELQTASGAHQVGTVA
jgi:uroporphyrinogen decarboxylase